MPSAKTRTLLWACVHAAVATVLVAGTGIALIEFDVIDDSPLINSAIPVLGGCLGLIVFVWRRDRDDDV